MDGFSVMKVGGRYWGDIEQMIRVVNSAIRGLSEEDPYTEASVSLINLAGWLDNSIQAYDDAKKDK